MLKKEKSTAKTLFLDIETSPNVCYTWGLWDQNIALNQVVEEWTILAYAAKWEGSSRLIYRDVRKKRNKRDDKELVSSLLKLISTADIIVTHNGKKFDEKKINARAILNELDPIDAPPHIDTLQIARKRFSFTSNKLEYLADKLGCKVKKLVNRKYNGQELWNACLRGEKAAWEEMKIYNERDVLALEEVYNRLSSWHTTVDKRLALPFFDNEQCPNCLSTVITKEGHKYTLAGKYHRFRCKRCRHYFKGKRNLLIKGKAEHDSN